MGQPVEGLGSIEQRSSCDWIKVVSQHIDPALYGRAPGKTGRLGKDRPLACPVCGPSVAPTASPHRGAAPRSIGRGEPARVRAWGRPPRAGGGGAGGGRRVGRTAGPLPLPSSPPSPSHHLPSHLPRCPAGSPACHGGRGCRAGLLSNEQQNFIMRDEFLYIANLKDRPGPPLVTGSVRHASRAAGAEVKHLLHSHGPQCRHWVTMTCLSRVCHDSPIVWFKPWCFPQPPPAAGSFAPADPAEPPPPVEVSKVYSLAGPNNHGAMPSRKKGSNKSNKSNKSNNDQISQNNQYQIITNNHIQIITNNHIQIIIK